MSHTTVCGGATRTPDGPVTVRLTVGSSELVADAWGDGTDWALDHVGDWVGQSDDPTELVPLHDAVADAARAGRGMRLASVGVVVEALIPTIVAQKVTGIAAGRSYRQMVRVYGEPAPGPGSMRLPPDPERLAALPYYDFHPLGIDQKRARTIIGVCRAARRIEATLEVDLADAYNYLQSFAGIGPWTTGCLMRVVRGDPDAVPIGDYHIPNTVAWALADEERGTDERMLDLLEPYAGQRGRVIRLLERFSGQAPSYGPKLAPREIRSQ